MKFTKRLVNITGRLFRELRYYLFDRPKFKVKLEFTSKQIEDVSPIWVMGMFRNGTSLVCNVLETLGIDFGDSYEQHQAKGKLKDLNPLGFFELFIYAKIARYLLKSLGKSGRNLPLQEELLKLEWKQIDYYKLLHFSLVVDKEPRVSSRDKRKIFQKLQDVGGIDNYFDDFHNPFAVKVPLLSPFSHLVAIKYTNSIFLVVFREPSAALKSVRKMTNIEIEYSLYEDYYRILLNKTNYPNGEVIYFSYDHLLADPEHSVRVLVKELGLVVDRTKIEKASNKIDRKLIRNRPNRKVNEIPLSTKEIYNQLIDLALNV